MQKGLRKQGLKHYEVFCIGARHLVAKGSKKTRIETHIPESQHPNLRKVAKGSKKTRIETISTALPSSSTSMLQKGLRKQGLKLIINVMPLSSCTIVAKGLRKQGLKQVNVGREVYIMRLLQKWSTKTRIETSSSWQSVCAGIAGCKRV